MISNNSKNIETQIADIINKSITKSQTPLTPKKYIGTINTLLSLNLTKINYRTFDDLTVNLDKGSSNFSYKNSVVFERKTSKQELLQRKNLELLTHSKIPYSWGKGVREYSVNITDSDGNTYKGYSSIIQRKFRMYGLVDNTLVSKIATELKQRGVKTCLEVGGGYGWLSLALSKYFKVTCTDQNPQKRDFEVSATMSGFPVEKIDAAFAAKVYGPYYDAIVVSWPHYEDNWVENLEHGKIIVYIGESPFDGQKAGIDFFKYFNMEKYIPVPENDLCNACIIGTKTDVPTEQFDMETLYTKPDVHKKLNLPRNWP
jgi:hypothetical protein